VSPGAKGREAGYVLLMDLPERETLGQFARERHVHYELEPEVVEGEKREVVGFQVRLFAAHGKSEPATPMCPSCVELRRELQSFAERLVGSGEAAGRTEIIPMPSTLYESAEDRDEDEVALTVRVHCEAPEHRRPGAGEELCLSDVRHRLEALGVPRR
jgi:hypothetical protein